MARKSKPIDFQLPPLPADIADFGALVGIARARFEAKRAADPTHVVARNEPRYVENGNSIGDGIELKATALELAKAVVGLALVVSLLLRSWTLLTVSAALLAALWLYHRWYVAKRVALVHSWRQKLGVRPIAIVDGWKGFFKGPQPGSEQAAGVMYVWTEDPQLERDAPRLHAVAASVARLTERDVADVPEEWRAVHRMLRYELGLSKEGSDDWKTRPANGVTLPASATGNERTYLQVLVTRFVDLPNAFIDRRVFLAIGAVGVGRHASILPAEFWWSERADELTRPFAKRVDDGARAASEGGP